MQPWISLLLVLGVFGFANSRSPFAWAETPPAPPAGPQTKCLVSETVLEDLKKAKEENVKKDNELTRREAELKAKEQIVMEQLAKLETVRDEIGKKEGARKKEDDQKVTRLTETLFMMSPKSAAKVLSKLEDHLAVQVITQMEAGRLAKVMGLMDPERASALSEIMVGTTHSEKIQPEKVQDKIQEKGGGKHDSIPIPKPVSVGRTESPAPEKATHLN